jgi:hypothetical protein
MEVNGTGVQHAPPSAGDSRRWVRAHYDTLLGTFAGRTVMVRGNEIVHVFDDIADPILVNEKAGELRLSGDWTYEYVCDDRQALL